MYKVIKRDGNVVDFDIAKVVVAITKAFDACKKNYQPGVIDLLALRAASDFEEKIKDDLISVEEIQDSVEKTLSDAGYADVAKAYILYRKQREKVRNINEATINYKDLVDDYLNVNDWRVKENSTVNYSIGGLILSNSGAITANYWLSEVYDEEIANAHRKADIHIHDLSFLGGYCAGWNLQQLIKEGLGGVPGKITSAPASHLSTLCNQMVNFMGILQNEWAGAQAFSSFDTYLAPFVKKDNLTYKEVKQAVQSFVFGLNTPSRWGCSPISTKILTPKGWMGPDDLKVGGPIFTWVDGVMKEATLRHIIRHKNEYGVLHQYRGDNYVQTVTPDHRCLVEVDGKYVIKTSNNIFGGDCVYMPGCVDGVETIKVGDVLSNTHVKITEQNEIQYDGEVWCPNTEDGTAIFKDEEGNIFISGNCQAPFTNITLDWVCPKDLKDQKAIVGGKEVDFTYGECQKEMDMVNKAFIEIMIEGDSNGRGFQYPIPSYSITKDFDWSETENNKLLFEMTAKYGTPYFSNYINSDMEPDDVRSMCPLHGKEKVLVRDDYSKEFHVSTIEYLYKGHKKEKIYDVILNGETKRARLNRFDGLEFYEVETVNGHKVTLSGNHLNLVLGDKIKETQELTEEDYLPFNITPYQEGTGFDYEDGLMVGAFLGDGSLKDDYTVVYSLNKSSKEQLVSDVIRIATDKFGAKISINDTLNGIGENNLCINLNVTSRMLRGLIEEYVSGKALTKELSAKCVGKSLSFRQGILDGYLRTDGGNRRRIYSASKAAIESTATLLASLGLPSKIMVDDRKDDETLSNNPVYSISLYNTKGKWKSYANTFVFKDDYMWFRIKSVKKLKTTASIGYCFEVLNDEEPYFMLPSGLVTHNCRLRLDLRELRKKSGGFFGSGESTGSVGVVTINMPRLAYKSDSEENFYKNLDHLMDIAARSLKIKRTVVTKLMDEGLYPYTRRYLGTLNNHFSTIGLIGMNEAGLNAKWLRKGMTDPACQKFAKDVLNHMRERLSDYQEEYGDLYNLEATPAESTTYRFAKHDKEEFPDIITANMNGTPYYTNSSHLPVGYTEDIFSALDIQDELQTLYTSGTVFHAFLGEKLPDWRAAAALVRKIAENYKLPYYTMSPTYSVCPDHGYITGEVSTCPHCGKKTEIYSRITGYYRPVQNWNDGKVQEFKDRVEYRVASSTVPHKEVSCDCTLPVEEDAAKETPVSSADGIPTMYVKDHCPKCKGAEQRFKLAKIQYREVNCSENMDLAREMNIRQTPTIIDPDGTRYEGATAAIEWMKDHQ